MTSLRGAQTSLPAFHKAEIRRIEEPHLLTRVILVPRASRSVRGVGFATLDTNILVKFGGQRTKYKMGDGADMAFTLLLGQPYK